MAKIYSAPEGYEAPEIDFANYNQVEREKTEKEYLKRLSDWCKQRNPNDPTYVGEVIKFPAADGYAMYMVASLNPVQLIHIELSDAYQFPYVENLTKKNVMNEVDRVRNFEAMWKNID
jgi:hypothetical protein